MRWPASTEVMFARRQAGMSRRAALGCWPAVRLDAAGAADWSSLVHATALKTCSGIRPRATSPESFWRPDSARGQRRKGWPRCGQRASILPEPTYGDQPMRLSNPAGNRRRCDPIPWCYENPAPSHAAQATPADDSTGIREAGCLGAKQALIPQPSALLLSPKPELSCS